MRSFRAGLLGGGIFGPLLAAAVFVTLPARLPAADSTTALPEGQLLSFLQEGQELFHRPSNAEDPQEAAALYRRALDRFITVAEEGRARNAGLYYNIANTYYRLGSLGEAILYYRRAELLNPADRNLRHNLAFARSQRADRLPPDQLSRLARVLFFWHYLLSPSARMYLFVAAFCVACAAAALAVIQGARSVSAGTVGARPTVLRIPAPRHPALPALIAGAVALLLLGSLIAGEANQARSRAGVIVAEEVVVRKGDGTAYQPSFVDPLHQGTEFVLLENRSGWYHVRFTDGRSGWLPASAARMVVEAGW
jgi:tetratricopeptide (TPR) repeat protein